MKWTNLLIFLGAVGSAHFQCFTPSTDIDSSITSAEVAGITDLGLDLYKVLSPGVSPKNFFFSPYSIWTAFVLTYFGSAGNTQRQLEATLKVNDKVSAHRIWKGLEHRYEQQLQNSTLPTFIVANRAYFHIKINLSPCVKSIFPEELRIVNFYDTIGSAEEINNFVSDTTRGRITNVVNPDILTGALMALVNAAFFKGIWKTQFDPQKTQQTDFFISPSDSAPVTMMTVEGEFRYGVSNQLGARVLELPYTGDAMSMFLLLPSSDGPANNRFINMVNNLNSATLSDAIDQQNMNVQLVNVQLPKFKFSLRLQKELSRALQALGIVDLFDREKANMTVFSPDVNLVVTQTIHEALVEVNEEGTEAAAATVVLAHTRITLVKPKPILFHCNEPFIFFILDNQTKNILFLGSVKNPRDLENAA